MEPDPYAIDIGIGGSRLEIICLCYDTFGQVEHS